MDGRRSRKKSLHRELGHTRRPPNTKKPKLAGPVPSADNSPKQTAKQSLPHSTATTSEKEPPKAKGKWTRKMTMNLIPAGHFGIACPEYNCNHCRTFNTDTILRLQQKAKRGQVAPTIETIKWETANDKHQIVDLFWDEVPALFRTTSAFIKMKEHLKGHHGYGELKEGKYPPLFASPTLEQKLQQEARARKIRNKNNSSGVDIPTP